MRGYMEEASKVVLAGFALRTEAVVVRYPDRYIDKRGKDFWNKIVNLLPCGVG